MHALERTSPVGTPFRGTCVKCGATNMSPVAALQYCPKDGVMTDEAALIQLIDPTKKDEQRG